MNILLTGGTGFLGSNLLIELIAKGHSVVCIIRNGSDMKNIMPVKDYTSFFNYEKKPLSELFESYKFDIIIHTATEYGKSDNDIQKIIEANIYLPVKLVNYAIKYKIKYFINTDTFYNKQGNIYPYYFYYSLSKYQCYTLLKSLNRFIKIINFRLEHVFGPKDNPQKFIPYIIKSFLNNSINLDLTGCKQKRDFIYIDDVVSAYSTVINNLSSFSELFVELEVGTGNSIILKEVIEKIKTLAGNTSTIVNFGYLVERQNEIIDSFAKNAILKNLGWNVNTSLTNGLQITIDSMKSI
jgi:nucleoside-diphosphate-sugar epimerase